MTFSVILSRLSIVSSRNNRRILGDDGRSGLEWQGDLRQRVEFSVPVGWFGEWEQHEF